MKNRFDYFKAVETFIKNTGADFFRSEDKQDYTTVVDNFQTKTYKLHSSEFQLFVFNHFLPKGIVLVEQKMKVFLMCLSAKCSQAGIQKVYTRIAGTGTQVCIDLGRSDGMVFEILPGKTNLARNTQYKFVLTERQKELPLPQSISGKKFIELFGTLTNFTSQDHLYLCVAFMLKSLYRSVGSAPILMIQGQQGTGKSTLTKLIASLVDPCYPEVLGLPDSLDDFMIFSESSYLIAFDNTSGVSKKTANTLCVAATGGGLLKRKHFSNLGIVIADIKRPMVFNGIDNLSDRSDVIQRCLNIRTKDIGDSSYDSEELFAQNFALVYQDLLGGLYTLLSECLQTLPTVTNKNLPRMADFCRMGIAMEKVLNLSEGEFLRMYRENLNEKMDETYSNNTICEAIENTLNELSANGDRPIIETTVGELIEVLKRTKSNRKLAKHLPQTTKEVSNQLDIDAHLLRTSGIKITRMKRQAKRRPLVIERIHNTETSVTDDTCDAQKSNPGLLP